MRYENAPDLEEKTRKIIEKLNMNHVDVNNIACIRSYGSKTRGVIARCHALGKVMQKGMKRDKAFYVLEFVSERFEKQSNEDKIKTIIHELMHIPWSFGGGFKHHDYVTERNVNILFRKLVDELNRENESQTKL